MAQVSNEQVALALAMGPRSAQALCERLGISQPTLSRLLSGMGNRVVRIRQGRSVLYALLDSSRGFSEVPVYRVDTEGRIERLGVLYPVRDAGYVMQEVNGHTQHSEGLPWWIADMRPQGFMGRAYAHHHAAALGLPGSLKDWSDTHAVRALLAHGHDITGNLLLGDLARERFLDAPHSEPIAFDDRAHVYARLSTAAVNGDETWSSAGGEQPKFTAYVQMPDGARHVLVKFTVADDNPVTERWRDLLLCEHHALQTLRDGHVDASATNVVESGNQRFLEVERFDRVGLRGRRGLLSLESIDSEFAGKGTSPWPEVTRALAADGHITQQAHNSATLLYAYGCLIGNTDMHHGNLAFVNTNGRPYELAPAFDMLPMTFQPRASGTIGNTVNSVSLYPDVPASTWRTALGLAHEFVSRARADGRLSANFQPCLGALDAHLIAMGSKINLLA